jgi:diaminohydroxyphosphoribosylaminopyrimidine deaminase/5-amino-6-(5-phosphoribosylamino)uracil reductase
MHEQFIRRCLELASRGRGKTGINPMVGSVLVRDGSIISDGFHSGFGKPHAERQLLENLDQKIRSDDVLYVNLEPCVHSSKKTPPCAQFLVETGIKTVVFGMTDPNPQVAGRGIEYLRSHGVTVIGPVLPDECARLNRGFVSLMKNGRPWITLKSAQTVDGQHAMPDGSPLKITSEEQDRWSHQCLRARHDAILVGVGTILADNPRLDVRFIDHPPSAKRIILDPHFKVRPEAQVVNGELATGTIIVCKRTEESEDAKESEEHCRLFESRGVRILRAPFESNAFEWLPLWEQLMTPGGAFHGISSILVEGGIKTWETFRGANMVDEEVVLIG